MVHRARIVSATLLAAGVLLVFVGLSAAMGFTATGMLASAAAIAALLYAGALWAGLPHVRGGQPPLIVFDRDRRVLAGPGAGEPIEAQFPEFLRPEVERRCAAALSGAPVRFACLQNGRPTHYDVLPVRGADGAVLFGILVTSESSTSIIAASA